MGPWDKPVAPLLRARVHCMATPRPPDQWRDLIKDRCYFLQASSLEDCIQPSKLLLGVFKPQACGVELGFL